MAAQAQGLNSLATIIKRLEAATSRLEDIAVTQSGGAFVPPAPSARPTSQPPPRVATPPAGSNPSQSTYGSPGAAAPDAIPPTVASFDERIINGKLKTFVTLTEGLGQPKLLESANIIASLFQDCRTILLGATACSKPSDSDLMAILAPMAKKLEEISKLKDSQRSNRDLTHHFQAIAEGASCVAWVQLPADPGGFVKEAQNQAEFYGNRVIKDYKEKDKKHVDWVRSYSGLIGELHKYVIENYKLGLVWNAKGGKASPDLLAAGVSQASGGAPPPPPPPPPPPAAYSAPSGGGELGGAAAVFAQINQGTDVTKGLKKVDPSQMTHKNPALRGTAPVPDISSRGPAGKVPPKPKKPVALQAKKPPKLELQGTKWVVEHQENEQSLVIEGTAISHGVNLYACKNTVVHVKGKVSAVNMTNCIKTSLLVESVISGVSITSSPSFQLQVIGSAPTIQIDATDSGQIYLSRACLNTEILTAKCSAINVSIPVEGEEDGTYTEKPVPEMLRSIIVDGRLVTNIVEHSG